jgi:polysaccharide biosynthesis protein PslH
MGGGTRLKVVEGLAMARPMVSTTLGCEGIAVRDGEHLLVADGPEAFTSAVADLLADGARRAALSSAGRRFVVAELDGPRAITRLLSSAAAAPG